MVSKKARAKEMEKKVAKIINAKVQPNSGATDFQKGDVIDPYTLFECKTSMTIKKSYSIKKDELDKIEEESISRNRDNSALVFNFGDDNRNYICMELEDFNHIYSVYKELREAQGW